MNRYAPGSVHTAASSKIAPPILDDGTGTIATALQPLFTVLTSQTHARSARIWLTVNQDAQQLHIDSAYGLLVHPMV